MTNIKQKLDKANTDIKQKLLAHLGKTGLDSAFRATMASGMLGLVASTVDLTSVDAKNDIGQDITIPRVQINFDSDQMISGYSYDYAKKHDMLWSFWANIVMATLLFFAYFKKLKNNTKLAQKANARFRAADILAQTSLSFNDIEEVMQQADKTAVLEIVQNLTKKDRAFFDSFIADPTNIEKQELAIAIIKTHLKTHPNELDKLFKAFDPKTIPQEIRTAYEQSKQNNTISWEWAVSQYNQGAEK
ncbi:MAG: hypothetical protein IJX89_01695 [Alphaproteobacteria bacterium]|nr:hypothetical protein [Alphaproteobacteria bacterium]